LIRDKSNGANKRYTVHSHIYSGFQLQYVNITNSFECRKKVFTL